MPTVGFNVETWTHKFKAPGTRRLSVYTCVYIYVYVCVCVTINAEMALFHGNPQQNNPVVEMSPFHPPALMPAGHKIRQALHRTGFGPKMMKKNSLYPAKPALPKPRLRFRPAGIRTGRHPGLDQVLAR